MKYIARFYDEKTLGAIRHLLRSKGIPTHVVQEQARGMGPQWALFVFIPGQTADALAILRDADHRPEMPVDADAYEKAASSNDTGLLARYATKVFVVAVPVLVAAIYVLWRYA